MNTKNLSKWLVIMKVWLGLLKYSTVKFEKMLNSSGIWLLGHNLLFFNNL